MWAESPHLVRGSSLVLKSGGERAGACWQISKGEERHGLRASVPCQAEMRTRTMSGKRSRLQVHPASCKLTLFLEASKVVAHLPLAADCALRVPTVDNQHIGEYSRYRHVHVTCAFGCLRLGCGERRHSTSRVPAGNIIYQSWLR